MTSYDLRVPLDEVRPDPHQPRTYFNAAALKALAKSIQTIGQRTPIEVRRLPDGSTERYEIIDGERRLRACRMAGVPTIRICIEASDLDHQQQHFLSVVSNFHREGHTHIEISNALAYQVATRKQDGAQAGEIIEELAGSLGKSTPWVYQYLQLQKLIPELQEKMHPEIPIRDLLRFGEALIISAIPADQQRQVYDQLLESPINARLLRARALAEELTGKERIGRAPSMKRYLDRFVDRLSADVDRVLDFKQSDFQRSIGQISKGESIQFHGKIVECIGHLQVLADAINRTKQPQPMKLVGSK